MTVRVAKANLVARQLDYELVSDESSTAKPKATKKKASDKKSADKPAKKKEKPIRKDRKPKKRR